MGKTVGQVPGRMLLKNVRMSYFHGFRPYKSPQGEGEEKYSVTLMLPKDREDTSEQMKAIKQAATEAMSEKWSNRPPKLPSDRKFIRDGDDLGNPEYEGHWIIRASNKVQPELLKPGRKEVKESDGLLYSGAWVHAIVTVWAQDNQWGKRLNASLEGVMFYAHDEPFSGARGLADEDWDEVADADGWDDVASKGDDDDDDLI